MSDEMLVSRLKAGDERALMEIYDRYWKELYEVSRSRVDDVMDAEECVQDVFTRLWVKRSDLDLRYTLRTYLSTAVKYQTYNMLDKQYRKEKNLAAYKYEESSEFNAESFLFEKELMAKIELSVNSLPQECQRVYRLSREDDKTNREIANELSISEKTVKNQITKALKVIRRSITVSLPSPIIIMFAAEFVRSLLK